MGARFRLPALVLVVGLSLAGAACGSSAGDAGGETTSTTKAKTTTTKPSSADDEPSQEDIDEGLMDGFIDTYRPGFELVFDEETTECVVEVFTEAALGDQSDEAILSAYEACGVSAQQVTGAMMAGELLDGRVSEEQARCMADEIGKLSEEELDTMDDVSGAALYETCGVDPESVDG